MRHKRISLLSQSLFALLVGGLLFFAGVTPNQTARAAPAAPVVDTLDDEDDGVCTSGDCSLREAIGAAAPGDTITFAVNGTIVLSSGLGELVIAKNLTIDGGGNISVSGNNAVRVFNVTSGNVTFDDLTIENGKFNGVVLQCGIASEKGGGAILNDGTNVTVKNSTFTNNTADCGGAILNDGTLTVEKSIFENNVADFLGGAIDNRSGKTTNVFDSTFANNTAVQLGGGINNYGTLGVTRSTFSGNESAGSGGGIYNQFVLTMANSTLSGNVASSGGGIYGICNETVVINNSTITDNRASTAGGGIVSDGGSCGGSPNTILSNSIASGNVISGTTTADDLGLSAGATNSFSSGGNNLVGSLGSGVIFAGPGDQINVNDPKLDPLADNGGATFTHALQSDSLALDNGECSSGPATDQRGVARPQDNTCDVGAYEKEQQLPVAAFNGTPTSGTKPLAVNFSNQSTGDISTYAWDFGDGNSSTETNPSHTYTIAGDYTVALTVSGPGGNDTETKTGYINVADPAQPPAAAFSGTPTSGTKPLAVSFSSASTGDISTYAWEFGDGNSSTETNPSHTYTTAGDYTVELTVSGPGGEDTETKTDYINVAEPAQPPIADFSGTPTSGRKPLEVTFSDASTGDINSYEWDFGDSNSSTEQNPKHTYANAGKYTVSLKVSGPGGDDTKTLTEYISVSEPAQPPTAEFRGNLTSGPAPLQVGFTNLSQGDIQKDVWQFGDNTVSEEINPIHTYNNPGVYDVILTVYGPGGLDQETKTDYITVNDPEVADFSATPTSGPAPLLVNFSDASTGDISSRSWDFGDNSSSTQTNPSHTYTEPGVYTVSLTVTYSGGQETETKTRYISVEDPGTTLDLQAQYLEVTQAVQDLNNSVPLVANKRTFVRFHARSNNFQKTTAKLTLRRNDGSEIELNPVGKSLLYIAPNSYRGNLYGSFLFELPAGYRNGEVSMSAELNPLKNPKEIRYDNNYIEYKATFESVPPLHLVFYSVGLGPKDKPTYPTTVDLTNMLIWLQSAYPLNRIEFDLREVYFGEFTREEIKSKKFSPAVLQVLEVFRNQDLARKRYPPNTHYYAMVSDADGPVRGLAQLSGFVGMGPMGDPANIPKFKWDTDGSYGDWYAGHEIGHTYGRRHVAACGADIDDTDQNFPNSNGWISPQTTGEDAVFGFNIHRKEVYPYHWVDMMTYCPRQWISDYTYEAIMNLYQTLQPSIHGWPRRGTNPLTVNFTNTSSGDIVNQTWYFGDGSFSSEINPSHTYTQTGIYTPTLRIQDSKGNVTGIRMDNYITVTDPTQLSLPNSIGQDNVSEQVDSLSVVGSIDAATGQVDLAPMFIIPDAGDPKPPSSIPGDYAIVLLNAAGVELARYPFTPISTDSPPSPDDEPDVELLMISELVVYVDGTSQVDIEKSGTVIGSVSSGAATPTVSLTSPNGGETLVGETIKVAWTANDSDGDDLVFLVQYSTDNGQTWESMSPFTSETEIDISARNIAGSEQALFRVTASDGIHTAYDDSNNPFTVPNRIPTVTILEPADGETIVVDTTIGFRGNAYDVETGSMADDLLQWSSNKDGLLGTGQLLSVNGLSEGQHTITFRADDGQGGVTEDSVQVTVVSDDSELPDKLLVGPTSISFDPSLGLTRELLSMGNLNSLNTVEWVAEASEAWIQLDASTGTTPDSIGVSFVDTDLAPGFHSAVITFTSPNIPGQSQDVNVFVTAGDNETSRPVYLPVIMR